MTTFIIGLLILVGGGLAYGAYCEKTFGPDDRETPAISMADGVDYVGMKSWRNGLIELLNIAGTGPILGPIQGILFGPLAFITIPLGCVLAGSMHDYFSGMISMRNKGAQMPKMIEKYLGKGVRSVYNIVIMVLMLLVGAVFIYTPGDLIVREIIKQDPTPQNPVTWVVYVLIFLYYLVATLFPIDQIIGRVYPIFGAFLVLSAVGIFFGVVTHGGMLENLNFADLASQNMTGAIYKGVSQPWIPIFFITVACGILSGFHATQATLISRSVTHEKEGKRTFFDMMLVEGFIAMVWAAGAMILFKSGKPVTTAATLMIGEVSRYFLGNIGSIFAIIGVIVLPITSGDTALRSLRLIIAERFNIDQVPWNKRIAVTAAIFIPCFIILYIAKTNPTGFNILWRYFAFTNQFIAIFALSMIAVYLFIHDKNGYIALIPGMFYTFIVMSFIIHSNIGFNMLRIEGNSYTYSYIIAGVLCLIYAWYTITYAKKYKDSIEKRPI
ncbi:MAG: carbon starvation CstA family protein [Clostridiaceae bacterium]